MHWPGVEPRSPAWEAAMLTAAPPVPAGRSPNELLVAQTDLNVDPAPSQMVKSLGESLRVGGCCTLLSCEFIYVYN